MEGQCYNFFKILRSVWPQAECWYDQMDGHVYTLIDGKWYDIRGQHLKVSQHCSPLNHQQQDKPNRWGARDLRYLIP
ncbi:hypothetical protein [Phyllobacterium chamaecytisi]|uniref:hypothetical protein n=1 Tax=Phyllobacterium chamaecytisi TaxID=2876082 RepID=UPI004025B1D9